MVPGGDPPGPLLQTNKQTCLLFIFSPSFCLPLSLFFILHFSFELERQFEDIGSAPAVHYKERVWR